MSKSSKNKESNVIKLFTINTWFEPHHMADRMKLLAREIERLKPDIISFQEVTQDMYDIFSKDAWFGQYKWRSEQKPNTRYFTMMFARDERKYQRVEFPDTKMARDLLISHPLVDPRISVATSHFESTAEGTHRRENQLGFAFKSMQADTSIIMGDTNINWADGTVTIPYPWIDVWEHMHPGDQGWTRDSSNPNCPNVEHSRLDRIFLKSNEWSPKSIEIVANTEHPDYPNLRPSDHYGLFCVLQKKPMRQIRTDEKKPLFARPSDKMAEQTVNLIELTQVNFPPIIEAAITAFSKAVDGFGHDNSAFLIAPFVSEIAKLRPKDPRARIRFDEAVEHLCGIYKKAIVDRAFGADYAIEQELEGLVDVWRMARGIPRSNTAVESAWGELTRGLLDIINEDAHSEPPEIDGQPAHNRLLLPQNVEGFSMALLGNAESFVLRQDKTTQQDNGGMVNIWGDDDDGGEDVG